MSALPVTGRQSSPMMMMQRQAAERPCVFLTELKDAKNYEQRPKRDQRKTCRLSRSRRRLTFRQTHQPPDTIEQGTACGGESKITQVRARSLKRCQRFGICEAIATNFHDKVITAMFPLLADAARSARPPA